MSIFYSLIARDYDIILSEYTEYLGNFQQITRILLYKIKLYIGKNGINNNKCLYNFQYDNCMYNYLINNDLVFLCLSFCTENEINDSVINLTNGIDNNLINNHNQNIVYAFLLDVRKYFIAEYSEYDISKVKSYQFEEFNDTIKLLINYYNSKPSYTKSGLLINNILNEGNMIIRDNINKYIDTDEKLNLIVQNEEYNSETIAKKNIVLSGYIKKKEKIEQMKSAAKVFGFILLFIFIVYLLGFFWEKNENGQKDNNNN